MLPCGRRLREVLSSRGYPLVFVETAGQRCELGHRCKSRQVLSEPYSADVDRAKTQLEGWRIRLETEISIGQVDKERVGGEAMPVHTHLSVSLDMALPHITFTYREVEIVVNITVRNPALEHLVGDGPPQSAKLRWTGQSHRLAGCPAVLRVGIVSRQST